ncbi:hypothetical protein EJB05_49792, partial [Eragrostis curvula]
MWVLSKCFDKSDRLGPEYGPGLSRFLCSSTGFPGRDPTVRSAYPTSNVTHGTAKVSGRESALLHTARRRRGFCNWGRRRSRDLQLPWEDPIFHCSAGSFGSMEEGGFEAPDGVVIDPQPHGGGVQVPAAVYNFEWNGDVCALCSDGGLLICCEGPCLRLFHATIEADQHHGCPTLGFTTAQVEATQHFFCADCRNEQAFSHEVCALCGDGGLILCCEGPCLRSFHATVEADQHHGCPTLGFTTAQVEVILCR